MNYFIKSWGRILVVLVVLLGMQAVCAAAAEKVLYISADGGMDNLDPRVLTSRRQQIVQYAMFEPLVRTHGGELMPGMAESWEISDDGKTYTFHLRDAKWSDGKPVTGGDFVHAFVRMFQICPASPIYDDINNGAQLRAGEVPAQQAEGPPGGLIETDEQSLLDRLENPEGGNDREKVREHQTDKRPFTPLDAGGESYFFHLVAATVHHFNRFCSLRRLVASLIRSLTGSLRSMQLESRRARSAVMPTGFTSTIDGTEIRGMRPDVVAIRRDTRWGCPGCRRPTNPSRRLASESVSRSSLPFHPTNGGPNNQTRIRRR